MQVRQHRVHRLALVVRGRTVFAADKTLANTIAKRDDTASPRTKMRKPGFDACHRRGCRLQSSFRVAAAATQICAGVGRGVNRSEFKDLSALFHQLPAPEVGRRVLASGEYWQSHTDDDYQGISQGSEDTYEAKKPLFRRDESHWSAVTLKFISTLPERLAAQKLNPEMTFPEVRSDLD